MRPKRFFFIMLGGLTFFGILIISAAAVGNVKLRDQSAKLNDLKLQNRVVQEQQTSLIQAKNDIEKYTELDAIARTIVPQDKDQAKTVREINNIALKNGIRLKTITFGASNLGQAVAPVPAPVAADGEKTPVATPKPVAAPVPSQAKAVPGIPGVYALEITVSSVEEQPVSYRKFLDFLNDLESNRRTAHVERISITPSKDRNAVSFDLTLNAYLKP